MSAEAEWNKGRGTVESVIWRLLGVHDQAVLLCDCSCSYCALVSSVCMHVFAGFSEMFLLIWSVFFTFLWHCGWLAAPEKGVRVARFVFLSAFHFWACGAHKGCSHILVICPCICIEDACAVREFFWFHIPLFTTGKCGCLVHCYGRVPSWGNTLLCVEFILYPVREQV